MNFKLYLSIEIRRYREKEKKNNTTRNVTVTAPIQIKLFQFIFCRNSVCLFSLLFKDIPMDFHNYRAKNKFWIISKELKMRTDYGGGFTRIRSNIKHGFGFQSKSEISLGLNRRGSIDTKS